MKKSLFSIVTASTFLLAGGLAFAQMPAATTTTTTTSSWTPDQGTVITDYSTTKNYKSFDDTALQPAVGVALPGTVTLYTLPDTVKVTDPEQYSYTIINGHPVVVEKTTRKVVHTWN